MEQASNYLNQQKSELKDFFSPRSAIGQTKTEHQETIMWNAEN